MQLATFTVGGNPSETPRRTGALVEGGCKVLAQAFKALGRTPPQARYERPIFYHPSRL